MMDRPNQRRPLFAPASWYARSSPVTATISDTATQLGTGCQKPNHANDVAIMVTTAKLIPTTPARVAETGRSSQHRIALPGPATMKSRSKDACRTGCVGTAEIAPAQPEMAAIIASTRCTVTSEAAWIAGPGVSIARKRELPEQPSRALEACLTVYCAAFQARPC